MTRHVVKSTAAVSPAQTLYAAAAALTLDLSPADRFQRLLAGIRAVAPYDAAALLALRDRCLVPTTVVALRPEVLGLTFNPDEHARLQAIIQTRSPVRFGVNDPRPDPFDGLVEGVEGGGPAIQACVGCALFIGEQLVGVLTLEALAPGTFDHIDFDALEAMANLTAAALHSEQLAEALEATRERQEAVAQHFVLDALERHGGRLLGRSEAMAQLRGEIDIVAASDLSVLVDGETGTGKELVVRTLHALSPRANQPLVHVNCAALPESIAESELFGHEKGAFTGATAKRLGKFELAHNATIFLDEIGELPLSIQPKMLRFLQFGEIQRVGADRVRRVNVRVIAATNRRLDDEVKAGRFRADLYHRLSVYPIHIIPLRDRREDILLLAGHLLDRARLHLGLGRIRLTDAARGRLESYDWPGNIRELEHVVTRAALRASAGQRHALTMIDVHHLDIDEAFVRAVPMPADSTREQAVATAADTATSGAGQGLTQAVESYQRRLIAEAVAASRGNWATAARLLQMDRGNLHRLARRLGLK